MLTTKSMRTLLLGAAGFTALVSIGFHIAVLSQSSEFSRAFENWIPNGVGPRLNDKRNNQKQQHSTRNSVRNVTDTSRTIPHHAIVGRPATIATTVRTQTDTGVDVSDPILYQGTDWHGDTSSASVMGMASGYRLGVYQRFVGSLRRSGFQGHVFLGVAPDVDPAILEYLRRRNVTAKVQTWVNCTYSDSDRKNDIFQKTTCAHPYPDIKIRWSRFPLIRDWLQECAACTGPVLITDVRDSYFQKNPFGQGSPTVYGLQVVEEHVTQTTQHWLTKWPIQECKGVQYEKPMLCSGTTVGTRVAMLRYLEIMYAEMKVWINDTKCRFNINGDDQSMHNYLFYSGQLPFANAIPHRSGGIVNTVGVDGARTWKQHTKEQQELYGKDIPEANKVPYPGANEKLWIGLDYNFTDEEGFFIEADGSRSRVIHQFDRFGPQFHGMWLNGKSFVHDEEVMQGDGVGEKKAALQVSSVVSETIREDAPPESSLIRNATDTGVDLTDTVLYETIDVMGDSSTATVLGMASGYDLRVYTQFVGSLRNSGYKGHVILGVAPDVSQEVLDYFESRNVVPKIQQWVNCSYSDANKQNDIFKKTQCAAPYADIKIRWSRFPLIKDWLEDCDTCTGPVLIMDVRDSIFQRDPFGPGSPAVQGLHVFEEDPRQTTKHWLTQWPIEACKGVEYNQTMLCSGTTAGTRAAMLKYLEIMYAEMKVWIEDPKCRFDINGDDQSIHNYLFYSGQLPFATAIRNRNGGTVNTVGVPGARTYHQHVKNMKARNASISELQAANIPYDGAGEKLWIGLQYNLTDDEGFFTEADGTRSRVVHQWDRFGPNYAKWLRRQAFIQDGM